jgi:two-component system response regulator RegX3
VEVCGSDLQIANGSTDGTAIKVKRKPQLLIVEDEPAILTGLTDVFVYHGYEVTAAADGEQGLALAVTGRYDLVLLDIMLPKLDGFGVCEGIRATLPDQPVIMLTARVSDDDIVQGLRLGADDYVPKPFSVEQLVLRAAAVLRRSRPVLGDAGVARIALGDLEVDVANLTAVRDGRQPVAFTRREMDVLVYLHGHRDRPVPREELLVRVWGYANHADIETRTVDIHVAKLRRKIEPDPKEPRHLVTVRGAGYRLLSGP